MRLKHGPITKADVAPIWAFAGVKTAESEMEEDYKGLVGLD